MADSASTELKIRLMEDGVTSSWGDKVDNNMQIIEHALTGSATASLAGGDWTLSDADYTEDEGKASILIATGSLGANRNIVIPNKKKYWIVKNDTTGSYTVTVKTASGTGKTVTQSTVATFWCDGADAVYHVVPMVNATTGAPATSSGAAASSVSFTATGSISSTNVQAAIAEVDGDVTALSAAVAAGYQPLDSDLTAIAGLSAADGNFIVGDGVTWTVESGATARASLGLAIFEDLQTDPDADRFALWDDSAGKYVHGTFSSGLIVTATSVTARVVQVVSEEYTAFNSMDASIPIDDTIPQNTEGEEIITKAITPTSATNKLKIDVVVAVHIATEASGAAHAVVALFQDSTANALAAIATEGNDENRIITMTHVMDAGTTSSTTFKVRCGYGGQQPTPPGPTPFVYVNGKSGGTRVFGGVSKATLTITEYTP